MDAFNAETFPTSTVRSRSNSLVYDPSVLDSDKDGIQDLIDRDRDDGFADQKTVKSDKFTNELLGGKEFGIILDRGGLHVVVVKSQDFFTGVPGLILGAASDPDAVPNASRVALIYSPCGLPTTIIRLTERDANFLRCGSLISKILDGTVEFLLGADSVVVAPAGAILTIISNCSGQYSIENSLDSLFPSHS